MALIDCPDCGNEVSDQAASCPRCGHPIAASTSPPAVSGQTGGVDTVKIMEAKLNEAAVMGRQRGGKIAVDSRSSTEAIFTFTQPPNHLLHGILTVVTAGRWLIVWLVMAVRGGKKETWKITVDPTNGETIVARV